MSNTQTGGAFSPAYRAYALGLLVVVYVFNFIDRSILGILVEPIRADLGVSDTLMGFLGGFAFALFYTVLGIPIARAADKGSRLNVLTICLALWSAATAVCGLAANFVQLLFARIAVAVGEAGGSPPSHSMISDMFPPENRATALAIYALGIPIGTMIGNLGGGWINDAFDWRTAFMVVGLPGVALAILVRLTLREPPRGVSEGIQMATGEAPAVAEVFKYLWSLKSFKLMALGGGFHAFVGYGVGYWIPAMFNRSHGLSSTEMGTALFYLGFASIAGTFLGGYMGDRLARRDKRWYLWLPGITTLISLPFSAFVYLHGSPTVALIVLAVPYVLGAYYLAPTFSMTQSMVGLRMRSLAAAILLFILNIIGMGLGPQFTGILSDVLAATTDLGVDSLRWALVASLVFNLASAVLYLMAARTLRGDLERAAAMQ
ncbi:MAG: MFS transporter [Proteobacteria bacterium]|nr:MFS transporter [Pseudomonadota bacterium]